MEIIIACGAVVLVIIYLVINNMKNKKKKDEIVKFIQNLSLDDFEFSKEISNLLISKKNVKRIFCVNSDKEKACILRISAGNHIFSIKATKKETDAFLKLFDDTDFIQVDLHTFIMYISTKSEKAEEIRRIKRSLSRDCNIPSIFKKYKVDLSSYFEDKSARAEFTDKDTKELLFKVKDTINANIPL